MTLASEKDFELAVSNGVEQNQGVIALSNNERSLLEADEIVIERNVESINNSFFKIGEALYRINAQRLYKEYGTFEKYSVDRWGWTPQQGYNLINAYETWLALPNDARGYLPNMECAVQLRRAPEAEREGILIGLRTSGEKVTGTSIKERIRILKGLPPKGSTGARKANEDSFGPPLNPPIEGLAYEPLNENGVVYLFGILAKKLGFHVESVQAGFPDCVAKRTAAKGKMVNVRIEFEFESKNFFYHKHDPDGCDMIICWRDNWPDCPPNLKVLELSSAIRTLASSAE